MNRNESARDSENLLCLSHWLEQSGELLVFIRYTHSAGLKSIRFVHSMNEVENLFDSLPASTSVIFFQERQLPLRGIVNSAFIEKARDQIPDSVDFMCFQLQEDGSLENNYVSGSTHQELTEELNHYLGKQVAIGTYPPFWLDNPTILEVLIPNTEGQVRRGVY